MITLINPKSTKYPQIPLGLLSVAAVWGDARVIDYNVSNMALPESDMYGITVMSCTYEPVKNLVKGIKYLYPKAKVILGGAHVSAVPEQVLEETQCYAVVAGEGEGYKGESGVVRTKETNLDSLPFLPYELVDMSKYRPHVPHGRWRPFVPMVTSRGCPFSCRFCSKGVFGGRYRVASPLKIHNELKYLVKKYGIKEVAFYDDTFTMRRNHVLSLCEMIAPLKLKWTCETRVNLVDMDLLKAMKEAGCFSISYGIESGNEKTLDYIRKGITLEQVHDAVRWTKKSKIGVNGYFMFVPSVETYDDMKRTVELAKELSPDYAQFTVMTPIAGSELGGEESSYSNLTGGEENGTGWAYKEFYLSPKYILRRLIKSLTSYSEFKQTVSGVILFNRGV